MEYLDIVDDKDKVIGQASHDEIYKKRLRHRIVHVLIFDDNDKMALQLRSPKVSFCPNCWSTAVGGHVQAGETYKQTALREFKEELGITSKLDFFAKDRYLAETSPDKILVTFKTIYTGSFKIDPTVVTKVEYFSINDIGKMIKKGEKFHPELIFLLKKYFNI